MMLMITELFLQLNNAQLLNQIQLEVSGYVQAITDYVLAFVRFIMPLMIYVIVFRIVLSKS